MSGAHEQSRKRRPPKMFLISTDVKVQDHLEGTIRLLRGFICLEQDSSKSRADCLWVKVLTRICIFKIYIPVITIILSLLHHYTVKTGLLCDCKSYKY